MENPKDVGQRLAWARKRAKLSQTELGDACGVTFQAVASWEKGRNKTIKSEYLLGLAKALNVDLVWLLSGEGSPDRLHASLLDAQVSELTPEQQALIASLVASLKK